MPLRGDTDKGTDFMIIFSVNDYSSQKPTAKPSHIHMLNRAADG